MGVHFDFTSVNPITFPNHAYINISKWSLGILWGSQPIFLGITELSYYYFTQYYEHTQSPISASNSAQKRELFARILRDSARILPNSARILTDSAEILQKIIFSNFLLFNVIGVFIVFNLILFTEFTLNQINKNKIYRYLFFSKFLLKNAKKINMFIITK